MSSFGAAGCVTALKPGADAVRVGTAAPNDLECKELGIVYGSGKSDFADTEDHLHSAQNQLRNKTADLGGNFVIMDLGASGHAMTALSGRALWCTQRSKSDGPASAGAGAMPAPIQSAALIPTQPAPSTPAQPAASTPALTSAAANGALPTPEQRRRTIDELRGKGLLSEDEYQQRRKVILQSL
ncbi:MAG TPA: DUF4156 domain-containing protein [Polyangiaceae bacterium]|jgi:hypothetical protein